MCSRLCFSKKLHGFLVHSQPLDNENSPSLPVFREKYGWLFSPKKKMEIPRTWSQSFRLGESLDSLGYWICQIAGIEWCLFQGHSFDTKNWDNKIDEISIIFDPPVGWILYIHQLTCDIAYTWLPYGLHMDKALARQVKCLAKAHKGPVVPRMDSSRPDPSKASRLANIRCTLLA